MSRCRCAAVALVITATGAGCATTGAEARADAASGPRSFRSGPPDPGPAPELKAPVPARKVFDNGLTVFTVQRGTLPLVSLQVVIRSGSAADPSDLPGVAGFLGDVLKAGTTSRSAARIAEEIETLGSSLDVSVAEDAITITCTTLSENFGAVFDVVADLVMNPAFSPSEIERVRRQRLADLAEERDDPARTANRVFRRAVFHDHPYGHTPLGTEAAVARIDADALEAFYRASFVPQNTAVVVVGGLDPEVALLEVEARLDPWQREAVELPPLPEPDELPAGITLVDKRNSAQSELRVGHLGVKRAHPDYFPTIMLNAVLGGMFNSRINMNLREDKAYTYGARSTFAFLRAGGYFGVFTAVRTDATGPALTEILKEIDRMIDTGVSDEELRGAKNRYSLSLPGYFQTVEGIGAMVSNIYLYDLPLDYYQQMPPAIEAVTRADILRVAKDRLHPRELSITVVGDEMQITTGLGELQRGAIRRVSADAEL